MDRKIANNAYKAPRPSPGPVKKINGDSKYFGQTQCCESDDFIPLSPNRFRCGFIENPNILIPSLFWIGLKNTPPRSYTMFGQALAP